MERLDAHSATTAVMLASTALLPFLTFFTYRSSGATGRKALTISAGVAAWATLMFVVVREWQTYWGPGTRWLLTMANLAWPTLVVVRFREYFVGDGLSLRWLMLVQSTRLMGGLFIVENFRSNTGTEFAYVSGIGDIAAAVIALTLLVQVLTGGAPNKAVLYFLIGFGVLDFVAAYSLSFLSTDGLSTQLFAEDGLHLVNVYPLGLLPWLLVPFAMAYHWMMYLTVRQLDEQPIEDSTEVAGRVR